MPCPGTGEQHCCWVAGEVCPFLEENTVEGRRWACGLYRKYGNWNRAINSEEYRTKVKPHFESDALKARGREINCRDWPDLPVGTKCEICGFGME